MTIGGTGWHRGPGSPCSPGPAAYGFGPALEALRVGLAALEALPDAELDPATRDLRDAVRAMLDRYDNPTRRERRG
jgi:hypothetical protein